jgi:outer membrane protein assembly factor BamB
MNELDGNVSLNHLTAKTYNSGFLEAHDTYNALSAASDGKIYYVLSSDQIHVGGKMYLYDPITDRTEFLGDLTEICGEKNQNFIPQGKSHVRFFERQGKLYFSTHVGYYELIDGMDRLPVNAPAGYKLYPGGKILSYDLRTKKFENLAQVPNGEGVVSMTMDCNRGHIFGITWPFGNFFHYDIDNNEFKNLGQISKNGEGGSPGDDFRSLCRSLVVDPSDGIVYFSTSEGDIFSYDAEEGQIHKLEDVNLRLDYFGKYDPKRPGSMGYNWREIFWYKPEALAFGVHGNSGYLFRFDPKKSKVELVRRITSEPSAKSGMFDQFSYGYLGYQLGPDGKTIYYLTGGPVYVDGKRVTGQSDIAKGAAKGLENLHLITYNIPEKKYQDHGPIFYENGDRPLYVNSIAVGPQGEVYALARITENAHTRTDLIKIENPFK